MKKLLLAITAVCSLLSTQAQAVLVTSTAGVNVNGSMVHDNQSGFAGQITFSVFGPDNAPPAFDQIAQWFMGVEAGGELAIIDTDQDPGAASPIVLSNPSALVADLGNFAMIDQFSDPSIADYSDVFTAFSIALGTASPSLEQLFNAVESITTESLFTLAGGLLDAQTLGMLQMLAPAIQFSNLQFDGQNGSIDVSSMSLGLGGLDVSFSGTAFLQAQYVNAPATVALIGLALAGLVLRRRVKA